MNMIHSEQSVAWDSLPTLHTVQGECLTSGIRKEEQNLYLEKTTRWGWRLKNEQRRIRMARLSFLLLMIVDKR